MKKLFLLLSVCLCHVHSFAAVTVSDSYENRKVFTQFVGEGRVPGHSTIDKFGVNPVIATTSEPEDVWEFGGEYPYDAWGTAPIQYVSSSDVDDTEPIVVQGLDINGDEVTQIVTLAGQSNVTLTTPLWRVFRMFNNGTSDLEGVVYCHTDPTPTNGVPAAVATRAVINAGNNQTLMALYTIPKGKVGFLYRGELGVHLSGNQGALAEFAIIQYKSRRLNMVFTVKKEISCMIGGGSSLYQDPRSFPDIVPALTDIKLTVTEVSQEMGIWGAFDIMLIDEDKIPRTTLNAIGQPGL